VSNLLQYTQTRYSATCVANYNLGNWRTRRGKNIPIRKVPLREERRARILRGLQPQWWRSSDTPHQGRFHHGRLCSDGTNGLHFPRPGHLCAGTAAPRRRPSRNQEECRRGHREHRGTDPGHVETSGSGSRGHRGSHGHDATRRREALGQQHALPPVPSKDTKTPTLLPGGPAFTFI